MTNPTRQGATAAELDPPESSNTAPSGSAHAVPDWKAFARSGEWRRAQAAASLLPADPEVTAAIASLSALQEDIRLRQYPAARRALNAYSTGLAQVAQASPGDAALLQSLAAPDSLDAALAALEGAKSEADPVALDTKLAAAQAHALTRAEALNLLGVLYALREEPDLAQTRFEEALNADAGHYRARMNLGNLALEAGDPKQAETQYREVLKLAPEYDGAHHNLGVALRRQGKVYESVKSIRRAQRISVKRTQQETREDMQEQMRNSPKLRMVRWVVLAVVVLVVVFAIRGGL